MGNVMFNFNEKRRIMNTFEISRFFSYILKAVSMAIRFAAKRNILS